jgi:hypothetical protein
VQECRAAFAVRQLIPVLPVLMIAALHGPPPALTAALALAAAPTCFCSPCPHACLQLLYPHSTVPLAHVTVAAAQAWQSLQPQERGVYAGRQAQVRRASRGYECPVGVVSPPSAGVVQRLRA